MARCHFCHVDIESGKAHESACLTQPQIQLLGEEERKEAVRAWNLGFRDGHTKINRDMSGNSYYQLGYSTGLLVASFSIEHNANDNGKLKEDGTDQYFDEEGLGKRCMDPYKLVQAIRKNKKPDDDGENK